MFGIKKRKAAKAAKEAIEIRKKQITSLFPLAKETLNFTNSILTKNPVDVDWGTAYTNSKVYLCELFEKYPSICKEVGYIPPESIRPDDTIYLTNATFETYRHSATEWSNCQEYFVKYYPEWKKDQANHKYSELSNRDNFTVAFYLQAKATVKKLNDMSNKFLQLN